jgi:hypothetical protein
VRRIIWSLDVCLSVVDTISVEVDQEMARTMANNWSTNSYTDFSGAPSRVLAATILPARSSDGDGFGFLPSPPSCLIA